MQRKTRVILANIGIALTSVTGGVFIADQLTADIGGIGSVFGLSSNTGTTAAAGNDKTVTGDAIDYQYGTIQVEVVRQGGKITTVNLIQAGANNGREAAFPTLQSEAVKAQGSNFGNLSGATYTTQAFKRALDSAISKLG